MITADYKLCQREEDCPCESASILAAFNNNASLETSAGCRSKFDTSCKSKSMPTWDLCPTCLSLFQSKFVPEIMTSFGVTSLLTLRYLQVQRV